MNKWWLDDRGIDRCVSAMESHFPKPAKNNRGASYLEIATVWFKFIPLQVYNKKHWDYGPFGMQLNINEIRKQFSYQYGNRQRWFDWFVKHYPIWQVMRLGNQFIGNSNVIPLIPFEWIIKDAHPEVMAEALELSVNDETEKFVEQTPIDLLNLERYINSTERKIFTTKDNPQYNDAYRNKLHRNLQDSLIIQKLVLAHNSPVQRKSDGKTYWNIPTYFKKHPWGRTYGIGAYNLQYMSSEVRHAAMGKGYEIDLNSSVFMFYKSLAQSAGIPSAILTELQQNKIALRSELAKCLENTSGSDIFKQKLIKKAITSLGFGAQDTDFGSIRDIIRNKQDLETLREHPKWQELTNVIEGVTSYVRADYNDEIEYFKKNEPGRFSMSKFMAMYYQQYESAIMAEVRQYLDDKNKGYWLNIHDGVMCYNKPETDMIQWIVSQLNPNATVKITKVDKYTDVNVESIKREEMGHKQFMIEQEKLAKEWAKNNNLTFRTPEENMAWADPVRAAQMLLEENGYSTGGY